VDITFELLPQVSVVALLLNPNNPQSAIDSDITQKALRAKRKKVHILHASNREEIDAAFTALSGLKIGALLLIPDPLFQSSRAQSSRLRRVIRCQQSITPKHMQLPAGSSVMGRASPKCIVRWEFMSAKF
jgi:hypothetical protein